MRCAMFVCKFTTKSTVGRARCSRVPGLVLGAGGGAASLPLALDCLAASTIYVAQRSRRWYSWLRMLQCLLLAWFVLDEICESSLFHEVVSVVTSDKRRLLLTKYAIHKVQNHPSSSRAMSRESLHGLSKIAQLFYLTQELLPEAVSALLSNI